MKLWCRRLHKSLEHNWGRLLASNKKNKPNQNFILYVKFFCISTSLVQNCVDVKIFSSLRDLTVYFLSTSLKIWNWNWLVWEFSLCLEIADVSLTSFEGQHQNKASQKWFISNVERYSHPDLHTLLPLD